MKKKLKWENGKYRIFDGIFCEVIKELKNCYKIKIKNKIQYVVESSGFYAHGTSIKQAKQSLIYKMTTQDTSEYKAMTLDTKLEFKYIVKMYRAITGACAIGCQYFVENNNIKLKKYTIREIIKLTRNQYGNKKLVEFFKEK